MNQTEVIVDLMKRLKLPIILVARTALGTINRTLLSLAALRASRLELRTVIMVGKPNRDNRDAIERSGEVPVAGTLPTLGRLNRAVLLRMFRTHFDGRLLAR